MSSFTLQRDSNNSLIKKTVNFSSTPSINNNSQSLGSTGSVSSASINILTLNGTQVTATGAKLNYVDVTPGTASASKALVLDSSRNISNINSMSCASLTVNGTSITCSSTPDELTGITAGTASASKALVLDSSRNISNINSMSCASLTVNGTSITGTPVELTGITAGTASASKALVLDSSSNITNINNLSSSKLTITPASASSTLLTDWTQNISPASSSPWQQITYSPELNLYAAVHNTSNSTSAVMTSTNGTTWTTRTTPSATWNCICWISELYLFILGGNGGNMAYSSDGITWTQVSISGSSGNVSYILWYPKYNQIVALNGSSWANENDGLYYSTTGKSWNISKKQLTAHYEKCMAYSPELSLLVATGVPLNGTTYYSYFTYTNVELFTDAVNSPMTSNQVTHSNISIYWNSICWSSYLGMFVAVADASSSVTSKIAYSTNGTSWTLIDSPSSKNWSKVLWCDKINIFVAVSSDSSSALMTSTNGTTWTVNNSLPSTGGLKDMYWDSNKLQLIIISNSTSASQKILITKYTISNNGLSLNLNNLTGNTSDSVLNSDVNMNYLVSKGGDHIFYSKLDSSNKQLLNIKANGLIGINNVQNPIAPLDIQTISDRAMVIRTSSTNSSAYAYFKMDSTGTLSIITKQSNGSSGTLDLTKTQLTLPSLSSLSSTLLNCSYVYANANSTSMFRKTSTGNGVSRNSTVDYAIEIQGAAFQQNHAGLVFRTYNASSTIINSIGLMPYSTTLVNSSESTGLRFTRIAGGTAIGDSSNSPFSILATGGCQSSNSASSTIHSFRCESSSNNAYGDISFEGTGSTWGRIRSTLTNSSSITAKLEFITSLSGNDQTCLTLTPNSSGGNLTSINNITYAGTLTGPSDIRLKENIEEADLDTCYNNMKTLKLKKYQWKEGINHMDNKKIGWIAQDVEQIFPKSIIETSMYGLEDCKTISTDQIVATMYGTIQKLMQKVEKLEEFINTLEVE